MFDRYRQFYQQPTDINAAKEFLTARLTNYESVIFIASEGEQAIGFTQLYPIFSSMSLSKAWLLNDLFVDDAARKKGVATALLSAAEKFGRQSSARWLLLETAHTNSPTQSLYEKPGWQRETAFYYRLIL